MPTITRPVPTEEAMLGVRAELVSRHTGLGHTPRTTEPKWSPLVRSWIFELEHTTETWDRVQVPQLSAHLWRDAAGRLTCAWHDRSLNAAVIARPDLARVDTPFGVFTRITAGDAATWPADTRGPLVCGTCGAVSIHRP